MRLSWSREPFSRWSALSCSPAFIHMFETRPSKVKLASVSMPNTFIVSEEGIDTLSAVTFNSVSLMLLLLISMVRNLAGFAANGLADKGKYCSGNFEKQRNLTYGENWLNTNPDHWSYTRCQQSKALSSVWTDYSAKLQSHVTSPDLSYLPSCF